ncbi:tRNA uridine-5-carboxymethylaminomethyl(34) synthesis GTPase MnmE [Candidatus Puniceispirillum sp.]|uniref:tRNA uridine-5-carboxymethylaminomethyl(34) synthesis GTPase MnmE n=1 Tax=Candidatus Puniceispirillum sp. TaxID=2026719 RepID=UPI001EC8BA5E|nr:tRNA uridine-5-carboxymethylaminomethyl(34) synthesis GTPase MnmE [Candidatus Puniceispirillum sp.]
MTGDTFNDTIFALATPPGRSAIAIIRISGANAALAADAFHVNCPEPGHFAVRRLMNVADLPIDEVLLLYMQAPASPTGEDVLEIHCHGSQAVQAMILDRLAQIEGFRPALPGEFTRRAFSNDKFDLSGVEGLADLIDAETPAQLHQAWAQLDGALRKPVTAWRETLIALAGQLEALIDFADEDLPESVAVALRASTQTLITEIGAIMADNRAGEMLRDGVQVALLGSVNAGKSTALNAISGRDAVITSAEAGTTRDIVSVKMDIGGVPVTFMDTAGLRDGAGAVESEGIRRARQAGRDADFSLIILDGSDSAWPEHLAEISRLTGGNHLIVLNKRDMGLVGTVPKAALHLSLHDAHDIERLIAAIFRALVPLNQDSQSAIITRARHRDALVGAMQSLERGLTHDFDANPELAAEDFRMAATALGRITGKIDVEDLLGSIFSSFCIGK